MYATDIRHMLTLLPLFLSLQVVIATNIAETSLTIDGIKVGAGSVAGYLGRRWVVLGVRRCCCLRRRLCRQQCCESGISPLPLGWPLPACMYCLQYEIDPVYRPLAPVLPAVRGV